MNAITTQETADTAYTTIQAILNSDNGIKAELNRKYMNTYCFPNQTKSIGELFAERPLSVQLRKVWQEVSIDRLIEPKEAPSFTLYKWNKAKLNILVCLGKLQARLEEFEEAEECSAQLEMFNAFGITDADTVGEL